MARLEWASGSPPGTGVYLRKSSEKQGEYSLPAQEHICRAYIASRSDTPPIVAVYVDVLSGRRADRDDYQRMLADARAGRLKLIVFHKPNRFGRGTAEALIAADALMALGVEIRIADMPGLDITRPEGRMIWGFLLNQAEFEVSNLGREALKGMREKVTSGGWAWKAADGYRNVAIVDGRGRSHATIAPDRARAAVIRLIFTTYARGHHTLARLVRELNALDARRRAAGKSGCARRSGRPWEVTSLYKVLCNPLVIGQVHVPAWEHTGEGDHQAIIQRATWDAVQAVLDDHGHGPEQKHTYLLQHRIVGTDGAPRFCTTSRKRKGEKVEVRTYYYAYPERGLRTYYAAGPIDAAVCTAIRTAFDGLGSTPAATIRQRLNRHQRAQQTQMQSEREHLAAERQRLLHHARRGTFSDTEIDAELHRLDHAATVLDRAVTAHQQIATTLYDMATELIAIAEVARTIETLPLIEQRAIVEVLIESVVITDTGAIDHIVWMTLWDAVLNTNDTTAA